MNLVFYLSLKSFLHFFIFFISYRWYSLFSHNYCLSVIFEGKTINMVVLVDDKYNKKCPNKFYQGRKWSLSHPSSNSSKSTTTVLPPIKEFILKDFPKIKIYHPSEANCHPHHSNLHKNQGCTSIKVLPSTRRGQIATPIVKSCSE